MPGDYWRTQAHQRLCQVVKALAVAILTLSSTSAQSSPPTVAVYYDGPDLPLAEGFLMPTRYKTCWGIST